MYVAGNKWRKKVRNEVLHIVLITKEACFYVNYIKKGFKFVGHVEVMEELRKAYKI